MKVPRTYPSNISLRLKPARLGLHLNFGPRNPVTNLSPSPVACVRAQRSAAFSTTTTTSMGSTTAAKAPRRFAPLGAGGEKGDAPALRGIVFDVDGTLCEPQTQMFSDMRSALSIPKSTDILVHIDSLPTPEQQESAHAALRAIETHYMRQQTPQPGLVTLMDYLESRGVRKGICTRNFDGPVHHLLDKFLGGNGGARAVAELEGREVPAEVEGESKEDGTTTEGKGEKFWPIVTREFNPPKPHPAGILHIARSWGLVSATGEPDASGLIMVGDSMDDMLAGHRAGAATVLISHADNGTVGGSGVVDLVIGRLDDLVGVLEGGFVGGEVRGE
ncbi:related to HAD superfamily hydrolase [Cephalotrichum gorgonifer]|uniref:Related to HAD superfamily hydrolase n=1 Tax=Cephalotrichum gorgonifer TaxID=2041049 RepID=A0AAE8SZ47_9PEZI|nr:related to HAD superfamily hydrolase [Cephalotrichum gorgonifer]